MELLVILLPPTMESWMPLPPAPTYDTIPYMSSSASQGRSLSFWCPEFLWGLDDELPV